jgi:hypothetical protein
MRQGLATKAAGTAGRGTRADDAARHLTGADAQERTAEREMERGTERVEERRLERPTRGNLSDDSRFAVDLSRVPRGFVMEWKRHELMGARDRRNQTVVRQYHWEPVPHKLQPHVYGHTCTNADEHIIVDGLGLYMRPAYLNEDAERETAENTAYNLNQQLASLRLSSKAQVGEQRTKIKREIVAVNGTAEG